uniref:BBSome interacting protein 1 n=1 Tax=Gasterosteus aculeatus aculeatus TaxID=481459 RepID=A0AAQ4QKH3_GASAC
MHLISELSGHLRHTMCKLTATRHTDRSRVEYAPRREKKEKKTLKKKKQRPFRSGTKDKHSEDTMPEVKSIFREVLPKQGQLSMEDVPTMVLCKPKLLPLKSVTLEKLEKMQMEAQEAVKMQDLAMKESAKPLQ